MELFLFQKYIRIKGTFHGLKYIEGTVKTSTRMVRQEFDYSCAAACLRQRAIDYGVHHSEEYIRKLLRTNKNGTLTHKVRPVVEKVLKDIKGVKVDGDQIFPKSNIMKAKATLIELCKNETSWIAQIKLITEDGEFTHAILVDKLVDDIVFIRDPTGLEQLAGTKGYGVEAQMFVDDFLDIWKNMLYDYVKFE